MKTFTEIKQELHEAHTLSEATYKDIRKWVFDKMENTDMDSEEMEKACVKKFGSSCKKDFQKAVSEFMGD